MKLLDLEGVQAVAHMAKHQPLALGMAWGKR